MIVQKAYTFNLLRLMQLESALEALPPEPTVTLNEALQRAGLTTRPRTGPIQGTPLARARAGRG